ncbi:MAG: UDP-glucose 4-epimerase GalE [Pseudomonadota bacterium]
MTVLVTGGAGYIGSHMTLALRDRDAPVVVIDNLTTGFDWAIADGAELVVGDVADTELVARVIKERRVTSIIHFAGSIVVPESVAAPLDYYQNNTVNSRGLIDVAVKCGVPNFIFSSTAAVYGMPEQNPVDEAAPLRPMSPYGSSKLMTEVMLADCAHAYDLNYVALRYFNVAGADPAGRSGQSTKGATHLIKVACETALGKRDKMSVFGTDYETHDGTCVRDYIHVTDLATAHLAALDYLQNGGKSDIFNCGYTQGYSVREVVDAVQRVSGVDFAVDYVERRPGDPAAIVAQSTKIRETLGWTPEHDDLDQIVAQALAWEHALAERNLSSAA